MYKQNRRQELSEWSSIKKCMVELQKFAIENKVEMTMVTPTYGYGVSVQPQPQIGSVLSFSGPMGAIFGYGSGGKSNIVQTLFLDAIKKRTPDAKWAPTNWLEEQALDLAPPPEDVKIVFLDFEAGAPKYYSHFTNPEVESETLGKAKSIIDAHCPFCKKEQATHGNQQATRPQAAPAQSGSGRPGNQKRPVLPRHLEHRLARQASLGMRSR